MSEQFWWFIARSSGMVAAVLVALTLVWGLLLSTRIIERRGLPAWLTDLHRGLAGLTVAFVGIHMFALWADSYVQFDAVDLLVPFASDWETTAVAWGVVATWLLAVVQVTSLLQRRLPRRRWHAIHLLSYPIGVLVGLHALTAGTDAGNPWFRWVTLGLASAVVFLTLYRVLTRGDRRRSRPVVPAAARRSAAGVPDGAPPVPDAAVASRTVAAEHRPPPYRPAASDRPAASGRSAASERGTDLL